MPLNTGNTGLTLPVTSLGRIEDRSKNASVLATLSPQRPSLYGNVQAVRMSQKPRAEIVAEGADKSSSDVAWSSVVASPIKVQTTVRMTDEVKWADEDHRMLIVDDLVDSIGESIGRAVDLIGIHGINPATGTQAASVTTYLNQTTNRTTGAGAPSDELIAAVGSVYGGNYSPTGLALDGGYSFALATEQYADGRDRNPGMGFGDGTTNWRGLTVAQSNTVSGQPEAADTNLRALVGDFTQVQWGFQRNIPISVIEYGDPDGNGDLQRSNEIAYRAEAVLYVAVFDLDAFAAVDAPTTP